MPDHDHRHGHDGHHGHDHGHAHGNAAAHSLALLADAGHNLGDVFGLAAAWAAALLTKRQPSARFCCGLGRTSVLAALGNAVALLLIAGGIALVQPDSARGRTANLVEQSLAVPGK
jgi:cobalt-zinc-cadmium efflux system protein